MKMKRKMRVIFAVICAWAVLANVIGVAAQERQRGGAMPSQVFTAQGGPGAMTFTGQGDNTFVFVSSEMSIDGKLVKGAPYSAQAVNESIQTLPGGNRIVRQNTTTVYRDSEGRTRRDQTISVVGGYSAAGEPAQTTFINDPVAGVNYILDAKNRTARKIDVGARVAAEQKAVEAKMEAMKQKMATRKTGAEDGPSADAEKIAIEKAAVATTVSRDGGFKYEMRTGPGAAPVILGNGGPGFMMMRGDKKNTRKEELGKQTVEGVEAEGTRYVTTIPAGEIGNEQPIEVVFESWYSPELQTVVMSKFSDPRTGENTYRLTNINRSEPAHSLFEVPADYTIDQSTEMRFKVDAGPRKVKDNQ
jgi:hypothetical protein